MTARTDTKRTLDLATEPTLPSERRVEINSRPEVQTMKAPPTTTGSIGSFPRPNPNLEPGEVQGSEFEAFNLDLVEGSQAGEAEEEKKTAREATPVPEPAIKLAPVNTEPQPWSEEIELNWTVDLTRDDLLTLRDFFKQGMDFSVVEQVILSDEVLGYPPEDGEEGKGPEAKASKDKPKDPPAKGGKTPTSEKGSAKDKGKKKKEPEIELVRSPPTFTTIATFHITLDHFLESEFEYQNIFTKGDVPPPSTIRSMDPDEPKKDKKDSKDKKKADKGVDKKNASNNAKDAKKSPRAEKAEKGGKGGKGKAEEAEEDEGPPPPLELEVTVKLHHWKTAMDSVKEEEERARAAMEPKGMGSKVGSKVDLTSRKNSVKP